MAVETSPALTNDEFLAALRELARRVLRGDQLRPRLLVIEDAGRYLGVSNKIVRQLIQSGEIGHIQRIAGRSPYLVDIKDLDGWVDRNKRKAN